MIFSIEKHIQQIIDGNKTQTRRPSDRYEVGKFYAVQPCRTCKGIPDGKILITAKRLEQKSDWPPGWRILRVEAKAEGGYTPKAYEELYEKMHPSWTERWVYLFEFWSTSDFESLEKASEEAKHQPSTIYSQQLGTRESKEVRTDA